MPDGLLQWYDARRGEGRIVRGGREYPVFADEMESRARVPGARVHFDIDRRDGVEFATNVTLRHGTRVSHRQRRFGDMVGARRPDTRGTAPYAKPQPGLGRRPASRPEEVAQLWAEKMGGSALDDVMLLYAPHAVVHAGDEDLRGRAIHSWLSGSELPGTVNTVETTGAGDDTFELRWLDPRGQTATTWIRVDRGEIVEQWIAGARPPEEPAPPPEPEIEAVALDEAAEPVLGYAEEKIRSVLATVDEPILHARVKVAVASNPAVERPARAQATIDVNGDLVRAQVAAGTTTEAVDLLDYRLRDRLQHRSERLKALREQQGMGPGGWRSGQLPTQRPPWFDRPPEEREVVRRKSFALAESTVDEAAFDMEMLDADFHLFTELATGQDALLYRLPEGRYGLRRLRPSPLTPEATAAEVEIDPAPTPSMPLAEAIDLLDMTGEPYVFFEDPETGRGAVAYRRYDGHYGVIVPADEEPEAVGGPDPGAAAEP